jgi:hypothetical protein
MARYNTIASANTVTASGTVAVPAQGLFTQFTGTAPYTVTIPNPTIYFGETQTFYNATSGVITITTPSGIFKGPSSSGTSSQTIPTLTTITLASDGTNYVIINENGGVLVATTINASAAVTLSPANANVVISPSGTGVVTISPATTGTMDNVNVGATTAGTGRFSSVTATGQIQSTAANNAATGSGQLYLNGTSGNRIDFSTAGTAVPATTTRSAGTKIVFYPDISATQTDYAMGMAGSELWYSVSNSGASHKWYAAASNIMTLSGAGALTISSTFTEQSSIAIKENVNPITDALNTISRLTGVTYDRKDGTHYNEAGLIAEEVYKVIPDIVTLDEQGKPYGIQYTKFTAYLIEAVKMLKMEIDQLKGTK